MGLPSEPEWTVMNPPPPRPLLGMRPLSDVPVEADVCSAPWVPPGAVSLLTWGENRDTARVHGCTLRTPEGF